MRKRIVVLIAAATITVGCKPINAELPQALDASPILGCYSAPDAPSFTIGTSGLEFAGSGGSVPFRYELPKVGAVIRIRRDASIVDGRFVFLPSNDRFYRVLHRDEGPVIRVAFGPDGVLRDYRRQPLTHCRF